MNRIWLFPLVTFLVPLFCILPACHAQKLLNTNISVTVKNKPVAEVLKLIEQQGGFSFSYNSDVIPGDSLVSIAAKSSSVRQVLDILLMGRYQYKEKGSYIIIQPAPKEKYHYITGQVFDNETEKEVDYASVYSRQQLVSALTDDSGFFKLRLRDRNFPVTLTFSKIGYADTSIVIHSETDSGTKVIMAQKAVELDTLIVKNSKENNFWLARLFVSSRLRAQSRNLSNFFIALPVQASLAPGLSTHGRLSPQITNKFSLNIYGGYTAGVNGVEIGGLFNISKKDARYLQMATTFNAVSGNFTGVQISGVTSLIQGHLKGIQLSSVFNRVSGGVNGVQMSVGVNSAKPDMHGGQFSILGNVTRRNMTGAQVAGIFNYAKNLKGIQIGMINLADSSSGYSIGLINIAKNGTGGVYVYANELVPFNIAWRSGSRKLYNILTVGSSMNNGDKAYLFGFGFGHEFILYKNLKLNTELTHQNIYLGNWKNLPILFRLQTGLNLKLSKQFSLNAGPSISFFHSVQQESETHYQSFSDKGFFRFKINQNAQGWLGYQCGLSWNYGRL